MKVDKHTLVSILLLIVTFALGFVVAAYFVSPSFDFPICGFDADEIVPVVNENYFKAVLDEINSAEESIEIIMYSMKAYDSNNSVQQLEDALIAAVKRGVEVKVILDQSKWSGEITSVTKNNEKTKEYLEAGGVEVKFDSLKETTHVKLIIVDGKVMILGSTNWTYSAFERNNEANVVIRDPKVVSYFLTYFRNLWVSY